MPTVASSPATAQRHKLLDGDSSIFCLSHVLVQMAVAFAEMHDTPVRMVAKGVLHGIVPWSEARPFLAARLRRR